jgi:hypothetical protein
MISDNSICFNCANFFEVKVEMRRRVKNELIPYIFTNEIRLHCSKSVMIGSTASNEEIMDIPRCGGFEAKNTISGL